MRGVLRSRLWVSMEGGIIRVMRKNTPEIIIFTAFFLLCSTGPARASAPVSTGTYRVYVVVTDPASNAAVADRTIQVNRVSQ